MYWSETRSIYTICILSGVLSIGVVAGPELLALLSKSAANVTPTATMRRIPKNPATTPVAPPTTSAPNPAQVGEVVVPATPLASATPPATARPVPTAPTVSSARPVPTTPSAKVETKKPAITLVAPTTPAVPAAAPTKKAKAPALPAKPIPVKPVATTGPAKPIAPAPAPARATTPLTRGRQLTRFFYAGQLDQVWAAFLPSVRNQWGSFSAFQAYRAGGAKAYGAETKVLKERVVRNGAFTYYTRTALFERGPKNGWTVIFSLDAGGKVREFGIVGADLLPGRRAESVR